MCLSLNLSINEGFVGVFQNPNGLAEMITR